MSEQPKISGELEAIRRNLSNPYSAPRGSVIYHGTPEYEASLRERAPQIAANEAKRQADAERRAALLVKIARVDSQLERIDEEIKPLHAERQTAHENAEAEQTKFLRAHKRHEAGKLSDAAHLRSAERALLAINSYNALVEPYNARLAERERVYQELSALRSELYATHGDYVSRLSRGFR